MIFKNYGMVRGNVLKGIPEKLENICLLKFVSLNCYYKKYLMQAEIYFFSFANLFFML